MDFLVNSGIFPVNFIPITVGYMLAVFGLSLFTKPSLLIEEFQSMRFAKVLAIKYTVVPVVLFLISIIFFLTPQSMVGFGVISTLPSLALGCLFVAAVNGNATLALLLLISSYMVSLIFSPIALLVMELLYPASAPEVDALNYKPLVILGVGLLGNFLPIVAGVFVGHHIRKIRYLPHAIVIFTMIGASYLGIMVLLNAVKHADSGILRATPAAVFAFVICTVFLEYLFKAAGLRQKDAITAVFMTMPVNLAIASYFAVNGEGVTRDYTFVIGNWAVLQYFGLCFLAGWYRYQSWQRKRRGDLGVGGSNG